MSSSATWMMTAAGVLTVSYRTSSRLPRRQIEEEIVRKARHIFKKAAVGLDEA
jgi:hypothetical protein